MRKLMWFTIGFAAACGICALFLRTTWILSAFALGVAAFVAAACLLKRRRLMRTGICILLGCAAGIGWYAVFHFGYLAPVLQLDGRTEVLSVTAADYSQNTDYGIRVDGVVSIEGKPYQIRTYLNEQTVLLPGDTISGGFRLRLTTPDAENTSTYFQGKGIFLIAYQSGEVQCSRPESIPRWCFPAELRNRISQMLETLFPQDAAPFTKALLLGDGSGLDYETDTAFKVSGIRHIIAVSGLHVSILYGLICIFTLRRRFLTAAAAMPVLLLFAAVAGFTPSVSRACIMVWLMLLATVFNREYDPATALSFSVLVMLAVNPLVITSVSLQMSVSCVAGILLFNGPINRWLKTKVPAKRAVAVRLRSMLCGSVSVTLSATSLVTPLSAVYFGSVSLVSVITNLLTLWAVNLIFNGLVITCAIGLAAPGPAKILAMGLSWPIRYVLTVAKTLASVPVAAVYTRSIYILAWLVFAYLLLAVFLITGKKRPGLLLSCGILGLCFALLVSWAEPLTATTRITMLDVGQGQSILLQSEGKSILVDCGGDEDGETADIIAETLLSQGISRLDGIIVTHYDRDHSGSLHHLLTRIDANLLLLPDTYNDMDLPEFSGEILYVWEDLSLSFGNASLFIYGPVYSGNDNENSLCVLFDTEKCDILITGDRSFFGERMLLRRRELPDVDILVAGHHGAADSVSEELLYAVTPETVLISVGQDNAYDHPAQSLLQRLENFGCRIYRTDLHGTIVIRR